MNGGSWEYVMGNYNNTIGRSEFSSMPESKYYNLYNGTSYTGHALNETAGWYSDNTYFVDSSHPWFERGGSYNFGVNAGVFNFVNGRGSAYNYISSRLSVTPVQ